MSKVYLALYKGRKQIKSPKDLIYRFIDWGIRKATRGEYSHCEIAIQMPDGQFDCYSSSFRDGGYTWAEVSFSQEYTDPKIHIQLEHLKRLPVLFLTLNLSAKTSRGVFVRSNMAKEKIDVEYSVYLYVEEMADT